MLRQEDPLPFRIVLLDPPPGVAFRLQRGKADLDPPEHQSLTEIAFSFSLRTGDPLPDGRQRFLGPHAQGPPATRFIYINSGTSAGQITSPWTRRAKVPLASITTAMIEEARSQNRILEARIKGTARDNGPACATVPLIDGGWKVVDPPPQG